jgi:hypothetical protein
MAPSQTYKNHPKHQLQSFPTILSKIEVFPSKRALHTRLPQVGLRCLPRGWRDENGALNVCTIQEFTDEEIRVFAKAKPSSQVSLSRLLFW